MNGASRRILILNQYFPPDPAPTGLLFGEIAEALRARGHRVECVGAAQAYHDGRRFEGRMKRELRALASLLGRGCRAEKPDVVISGSSPPCLLLAAGLVARRHGARSIHWAMDLYPDLAVALGEISPGPGPALLSRLMRWAGRRGQMVSVDEDMAALLARRGLDSVPIRPWVTGADKLADLGPVPRSEPFRWLYSGNLGRAHEWRTLIEAQAVIEARDCPATLVFQGGGAGREGAERRARELGLRRVEFAEYAPAAEFLPTLLEAGALVATQLPETAGMLWPSKLALLAAIPRPFLWIGPEGGQVAALARTAEDACAFAVGDAVGLADVVEKLTRQSAAPAKLDVARLRAERQGALERWTALVEQ